MADTEGSRVSAPEPTAPNDRPLLLRLTLGAAVVAGLLIAGIVYAAGHGLLPARVALGLSGDLSTPQTTNATTTATGSLPIYRTQCEFVQTGEGGQCVFALADQRGDLVEQGLAIPVPRAWLQRIPRATSPDNMGVISALVRSPYAPAAGVGLESMSISVDPTYAELLATVGVTPQELLQWIYQHVPPADRPPWVG